MLEMQFMDAIDSGLGCLDIKEIKIYLKKILNLILKND